MAQGNQRTGGAAPNTDGIPSSLLPLPRPAPPIQGCAIGLHVFGDTLFRPLQ